MKNVLCLFLFSLFIAGPSKSQTVVYSDPDRDEPRNMSYEIIGKLDGKIFIYKGIRDINYMCIYDADMKLVNKIKLDFVASNLINVDFISYSDKILMFYQYTHKNVVYSMAVKLNNLAKPIAPPQILDTTNSPGINTNIYSLIHSDDKQKIVVYKIHNKDDKQHGLSTFLYDKELNLLHKSNVTIPMPDRNDFLSSVVVDNDGDIALLKQASTGNSNDININKLTLLIKPALQDVTTAISVKLNNINLDDLKLKPDNANRRFLILSFYNKQRRGNVDGLFCFLWDKMKDSVVLNSNIPFPDDLRSDAKTDGNLKSAFNDFFLKNIVIKQDGGFAIATESVYMSSRGSNLSRWDYMGYNNYLMQPGYNYYNSMGGYYPWSNYNYNSFNSTTRYFADNIVIVSFDPSGKIDWSNVINKSQYDDNSDNYISYGVINTGEEFHFLYNVLEKRDLVLTDQSVAPGGQISRKPTFKNLDKGYDFMPRMAKQIGARQLIIPCLYRNLTCFAKIDF